MPRNQLIARLAYLVTSSRNSVSAAMFAVAVATCGLGPFSSTAAVAKSNRCPNDTIEMGKANAVESSRISHLWKALHGPGADGGDGPLGCPIGRIEEYNGPDYKWRGVGQIFQRGWILIGRGDYFGSEYAAVRGWDSWTVWKKGIQAFPAGFNLREVFQTPAAPDFGGQVEVTPRSRTLGLLQCPDIICSKLTLTPELPDPDRFDVARPFDFAAHLDINMLAAPNVLRNVQSRTERVKAIFTDWLPCFTRSPTSEDEIGEDAVAHAIAMLQRDTPCPLTGIVPSKLIKDWLQSFKLPDGALPGTDSDSWLCRRKGDLDVVLVQMLNLALKNEPALNGLPLAHIYDVLAPWGGEEPRADPYVTPQGTCFGYSIIETENHILMQETARYLINVLPRSLGSPRGHILASEAEQHRRDWLVKFLQQIVRRDFYEFNSLPYSRWQMKALFALHDHAPDESVRVAAKGVLDWLFAKQAVSGNLDRDHRPYRRVPDSNVLSPKEWWSKATTPVTTAISILAGPVQHVHYDLDLQLSKEEAEKALADLVSYPELGTASEFFGAELVDVANTDYALPASLAGWFERRFIDEEANRNTYIQAIHHGSPIGDDPALFRQPNAGSELVSGNRNWTIIAGGTHVPPGWPGDARVPPGGLAIPFTGAFANKKQRDKLWESQPGTIRETMLIPTPVGLSRDQTIRFQGSEVSSRDGSGQVKRLCVAEGFLCGFDLRMPDRPFPSKDARDCPPIAPLPPDLITQFESYAGHQRTITEALGCLMKTGSIPPGGIHHSWQIWTFERGMLFISDPYRPEETFGGAWIEGRTGDRGGRLRVVWKGANASNWFRVHAYDRNVELTGGEPPGGWLDPLLVTSQSRTQYKYGDVFFDLEKVNKPATWNVLLVGCETDFLFFGPEDGHSCYTIWPKMTVSVGPEPRQSFSCAVYPPHPATPHPPTFLPPPSEGLVMEVGSCLDSPYGLFVYEWHAPCPDHVQVTSVSASTKFDLVPSCPSGVADYGFVAVAPSRGWTAEDFRRKIELSMNAWRANGNGYFPGQNAAIDVPISPPVSRSGDKWVATGMSSHHTVTFRWSADDGSAIIGDTGAPGLFNPAALGDDPEKWPTAIGHISAPDVTTVSSTLVHSSGTGCFTMAGYPTPADPDPVGLVVDLRDIKRPVAVDVPTSKLPATCP